MQAYERLLKYMYKSGRPATKTAPRSPTTARQLDLAKSAARRDERVWDIRRCRRWMNTDMYTDHLPATPGYEKM